MKKPIHRNAGLWASLSLLALALAACESKGGAVPFEPVEIEDVIGKWSFTQVRWEIETKTTPATPSIPDEKTDTLVDVAGMGYFIEFTANGDYAASFPRLGSSLAKTSKIMAADSGTWTVSGNTVITVSDFNDTLTYLAQFDAETGKLIETIKESLPIGVFTSARSGRITFWMAK